MRVLTRTRGVSMKISLLSVLMIAATAVPTSAMVVTTPKDGAYVTSPFNLVASARSCDSKPVASLGYSIDSGATTIEPIAFGASVSASIGKHILHVKCWGNKVHEDQTLVVTVISTGTTTPQAATPVFSPAAGNYTSGQSVKLSASTPGASIYYTTDGSTPTTSSPRFTQAIAVTKSQVIQAIATAPGYSSSGLASADYSIRPFTPSGPVIPSYAIASRDLQLLDTWRFEHDLGTPGASAGKTMMVSEPALSGSAREFTSSYTNSGGERFSVSYADDTTSMNFVYDTWVRIEAGSSIANLEMDSNQVTANGETVIYAFQCDGYSHVWDYSGAGALWVRSAQPCDLSKWSPDTWHHIQISYSRDDFGNVTYHSVWLDGAEQAINSTVPSSFALGWQVGVVQTQFQLDGLGASGASTAYVDNFTI